MNYIEYVQEENTMIDEYMQVVRDRTIEKLTPLELAALYEDFQEFRVRLYEEREINRYEHYED